MTRSNPTSTTNRCFTCGSCILLHVHASLRLFRHRPLLRFSVPHFLQHRLQLNHLNGRLGVFCVVFARAFTLPRQNACFCSGKIKIKIRQICPPFHVESILSNYFARKPGRSTRLGVCTCSFSNAATVASAAAKASFIDARVAFVACGETNEQR